LMPDISFTGARMVTERAQGYMQEHGGTLEGADIAEMFTGVEESQINEAQETRDAMRDIQRSGEAIMREQLGAMQANARFQESQLGISAAMAGDAAKFYQMQLGFTRVGVELMDDIRVSSDIQAASVLFNPEFLTQLRGAGSAGRGAQLLVERVMGHLQNQGIDINEMARTAGLDLGRDIGRGVQGAPRGIIAQEEQQMLQQRAVDLIERYGSGRAASAVIEAGSGRANAAVERSIRRRSGVPERAR